MARITGVGGIFFKARDPKALVDWYRDTLGLDVQAWGGALLPSAAEGPPHFVWSPFSADTTYMEPSTREFMLNFAVDDLDGVLAQLETKGVNILGRADDENGRFAWLLDPEGTKIELWEPKKE
ncbi:MAG TPA: VOC family protein [Rhizomicrobium sp.]|nr:VOC family protein [Rhizomicrobium sp.]